MVFLPLNNEKALSPFAAFKKKFALHFLNITQFLGALNDNVFKFLTVFLLIDLKGVAHSSEILFVIGIVYVLPFLLFSNTGGIFADRFSKQKIIVLLKFLEIVIMLIALIAFHLETAWAVYFSLFLLSAHSAFFGPPKYSVIAEIVDPSSITKANSIITSSTYLAIILGSFLASFVTQISGKNFVLAASFCLAIATVGFFTSLFIPKTIAQKQKQKIDPIFIKDIYKTLKFCKQYKFFLLAMSGSFFFLFIGAFLQLNIVPFAIESLGLSEVGGGYLFLSASIGIALGAVIAGKTSEKGGNLGLSSLAICITAFFFFLLPLCTFSLPLTVLCLMMVGFGGGMFVVPIDSFIQAHSPDEKRGKIVAAANFLSFCGVLFAPILIYLFGAVFHFSAGSGFFLMGFITLGYFFFLARKLSGIFLNYASRKLLYPFFHVQMSPAEFNIIEPKSLIVPTPHISYGALIMGLRTKMHLYIAKPVPSVWDRFWHLFKNIHFIYFNKSPKYVIESFDRVLKLNKNPDVIPCLIISPSLDPKHSFTSGDFIALKKAFADRSQFVALREEPRLHKKWRKIWKPIQVTLDFDSTQVLPEAKKKHLLAGIYSGKK